VGTRRRSKKTPIGGMVRTIDSRWLVKRAQLQQEETEAVLPGRRRARRGPLKTYTTWEGQSCKYRVRPSVRRYRRGGRGLTD